MSRESIRNTLKSWSQRRNIPDATYNEFIEFAISKANRALRIPSLEAFGTLYVNSSGYCDVPADFLEAKELKIVRNGVTITLDRKSINEVDTVFDQQPGTCPRMFGRFGNQFRIAPWDVSTDNETDAEAAYLYYYHVIPKMNDDADTNWFTEYSPETIVYGAMAELARYTRDDEAQRRYDAQFTENINILQTVEDRAAWGGNTPSISLGGST